MTDIEKFVQKIIELQEEHEKRPFTSDELKKIAESLGMSDDDWAMVQEEARDYSTRGTGYLRHGLWVEAVKEFEQALILLPGDADVLCGLAEGHTRMYLENYQISNKQKALVYATECLDVQPDNEHAFGLLSRVKQAELPQFHQASPRRHLKKVQHDNSGNWLIIGPILVLVILMGVIIGPDWPFLIIGGLLKAFIWVVTSIGLAGG